MRKNILKIQNLGPKIQTQVEVKSLGFVKHFRQVYVPMAGIMRVTVNGENTFMPPAWRKVRYFPMQRRIVVGLRSQKNE